MADELDPIDELAAVLAETLRANALRLTTSRGGYVGGGQPHATLDSDPGAVEDIARGLLARKVAEPSRATPERADPDERLAGARSRFRTLMATPVPVGSDRNLRSRQEWYELSDGAVDELFDLAHSALADQPTPPAEEKPWRCDWQPDELNPGPDCPYCAGDMCARFDGLGCTHDRIERHGYPAGAVSA